jgi:hypothetical protein
MEIVDVVYVVASLQREVYIDNVGLVICNGKVGMKHEKSLLELPAGQHDGYLRWRSLKRQAGSEKLCHV